MRDNPVFAGAALKAFATAGAHPMKASVGVPGAFVDGRTVPFARAAHFVKTILNGKQNFLTLAKKLVRRVVGPDASATAKHAPNGPQAPGM